MCGKYYPNTHTQKGAVIMTMCVCLYVDFHSYMRLTYYIFLFVYIHNAYIADTISSTIPYHLKVVALDYECDVMTKECKLAISKWKEWVFMYRQTHVQIEYRKWISIKQAFIATFEDVNTFEEKIVSRIKSLFSAHFFRFLSFLFFSVSLFQRKELCFY